MVSKRKNSSKFRESFTKTVTRLVPNLFRLYFKRSARILSNLQAVIHALLLVKAANWVVLLPGAAHISRICASSFGFKIKGGSIDDKLCKYIVPFSYNFVFVISYEPLIIIALGISLTAE